jgi:type 1 glutamine amidotransferase
MRRLLPRLAASFVLLVVGSASAPFVALADDRAAPAADSTADRPLKIHMIGAGEYSPVESLTEFKGYLEGHFRIACTTSWGTGSATKLDNLDQLPAADLLFLFARRMSLKADQMAIIRQHWEQGKPIVGLRTASHAFQKADNEVFDKQVLGGNYGGGGPTSNGAYTAVPAEGAADHPILKGVQPFRGNKYSYGQGKLADDAVVLQICDSPRLGKLPVTWLHTYKGGRTFYSSLGAPDDFKDENFRRLLVNAICWTTHRDPDKIKK